MNRWFFILVILPVVAISWNKPASQKRSVSKILPVAATDDTLKLGDLVFSDFFSPNDDGYNDRYIILNLANHPNNSLKVFNRWGEVVYQAEPYANNWDGTSNFGQPLKDNKLTDGVYYFDFYDGHGNHASGKITLKR